MVWWEQWVRRMRRPAGGSSLLLLQRSCSFAHLLICSIIIMVATMGGGGRGGRQVGALSSTRDPFAQISLRWRPVRISHVVHNSNCICPNCKLYFFELQIQIAFVQNYYALHPVLRAARSLSALELSKKMVEHLWTGKLTLNINEFAPTFQIQDIAN